jgi:hypothetical protein
MGKRNKVDNAWRVRILYKQRRSREWEFPDVPPYSLFKWILMFQMSMLPPCSGSKGLTRISFYVYKKFLRVEIYICQYSILGYHSEYEQMLTCSMNVISVLPITAAASVQTLKSGVRIPIEARMYVCVYSVFVLSCVQVAALRRADPPSE